MASLLEPTYGRLADLNLWFKLREGTADFTLTDYPDIIPFRWEYFRDNWDFIKANYEARIDGYGSPNLLRIHIRELSDFIAAQKNSRVNPFRNSDVLFQFYAIFDTTLTTDVPLTTEERTIIDNRAAEISGYNRDDFVLLRQDIVVARDQYADQKGLNDETYNEVFNRGSVEAQTDPTNLDMNYLQELNNGIKAINFILANQFSISPAFVDPYAQARVNANNPDIDIETYQTGYLVNVPYGADLRNIARLYMDDEERWIEIAIANGLKPPYIDEVGERVPLTANAAGNKVTIPAVNQAGELNSDKVFINQVIFIQSDTERFPDQRIIVNIQEIPISGDLVIELDGESDLNKYRTADNAHLRIFKPQTINSSLKILIPDQNPNPDTRRDITPWFLNASPEDAKRQKIDLFIDENGELQFDNTGDVSLSYSFDNSIQAIRLKLQIKEAELFQHPNFGLTDVVGIKNDDLATLIQLLSDSIAANVAADSRFDRIETLDIQYSVDDRNPNAPAGFDINMVVSLAGSNQTIPISFRINL